MKKHLNVLLFTLMCIAIAILLSSSEPVYYGQYSPVYMDRAEMESAIAMQAAQPLRNTGKIYLYGQYILVNEKFKGIHVVDNSNPASPVNMAFIHIDGCIDMAVKSDVLYADNAVDLIALKITNNFSGLQVTERIKGIFPETECPDGYWGTGMVSQYRPKNGILVAWKKKN